MIEPTYWLPEWWDLPTPGYKWHRIINQSNDGSPGAFHQQLTIEIEATPPIGFSDGGPPGPPPAAAAAVQVTDEELHAIKRHRRQSREKRHRR